jgi:CubicO group peptidase (beta-lactamase class C family)
MDRYWSDPDLSHDPRRMKQTVRMALSHRTGLPNWRDAKGLAFDHKPTQWTASGVIAAVSFRIEFRESAPASV